MRYRQALIIIGNADTLAASQRVTSANDSATAECAELLRYYRSCRLVRQYEDLEFVKLLEPERVHSSMVAGAGGPEGEAVGSDSSDPAVIAASASLRTSITGSHWTPEFGGMLDE